MKRVAIVGGCRTAFVKAGGAFAQSSFLDLGSHVVAELAKQLSVESDKLDEVVFGTVLLDPRAPNFAREVVFRAGLSPRVGAHSVSNNCISGLLALSVAADSIRSGRTKCVFAGGAESMSRPTLTLKPKAEEFYLALARARGIGEKLSAISKFRPSHILPLAPSPREPSTGLTMGEHCELMAREFEIPRESQDLRALKSHQNAAKAEKSGLLAKQIVSYEGIGKDNLVRADTSLEKLGKLKPVFDKTTSGTLTAGNSSALTDGASVVCVMDEECAKKGSSQILGYIEAIEFAAVHPQDGLLMAPALAVPRLLNRAGLKVEDIDVFEIHEAFAAQVEANLHAWKSGWARYPEIKPIGQIPEEKINPYGGSIAIGHPFAATGGRLVLSAVEFLRQNGGTYAVLSVCAAGAMGCAVLIKRS